MLTRIILIALQIVTALLAAPYIVRYIPIDGDPRLFVYAVVFAVLIWLVGLVGAEVLKGIDRPSSATLTVSLVCAAIGAALIFIPGLLQAIPFKIKSLYLPLAGALLGYLIKSRG